MSTINQVADAVVASLNAATFGQVFTAERKYQPAFELAELDTLRVSVVPKALAIETADRGTSYFDCTIDIGVQQKVDPDDAAEIDALMDLGEQIADHLRMQRLDDLPAATWLSIANEPVFVPEHLNRQRVFTSVLTVVYRVRR